MQAMSLREFKEKLEKLKRVYVWINLAKDKGVYIKIAKKQCYWLVELLAQEGKDAIPAHESDGCLYIKA